MSGLSKEFATQSEASTSQEGLQNRRLKVTLLSSEWRSSTDGDLSTISRELAIQLAKFSNVEVSVFLPRCSEEDRRNAESHDVQLIEAEEMVGLNPVDWLINVPDGHVMDCVLGHGVTLGKQVQFIKKHHHCKWIQVVHTAPEELGIYRNISEGEKQQRAEVKLCQLSDEVVAIGPKLADAYKRYLRSVKKEQNVFDLTPGIFSEFLDIEQAVEERMTFCVLVIGNGDSCKDFNVKGFDIAVKAIAELNDKSYRLRFVYSQQEKGEEIAEMLLQHGINRNQLIVCSSNDSREVLANLFCEVDLAIMPSRSEGFGLLALKALSAGLPVLVSGNSGLGVALKEVPFGSQCVVDLEDPRDWAREIKAVRQKHRKVRLRESKLLRDFYHETYEWERPCKILVEKIQNLALGSSEIRATSPVRSKRPSSLATPDQPSKRIRQELTPHNQPGGNSLEGSSGCYFQDSSVEYGQFPSAPDKISYQRTHIQSHKNPTSEEGDLCEDRALSFFTEFLRREYNRRARINPLFWDSNFMLRLDDVYTRLSIVSRRITDSKLEDNEVNMFDIFNTLNKGDDAMVLVEGSPGIGKTTFCLKFSHDWANKKIPKESSFPVFKLLLLLKCRDIRGSISKAIFNQLFPNDMEKEAKKRLLHYIEDIHNQPSILIVLDGLDELPETAENHVNELLDRQRWSFCHILATSRQEKGILMRQNGNFAVLLQIMGFTEADAFQYIRKHFVRVDEQKREWLIQAIQENSFLHALPSNPLNLLLLCVVFEDYEGNLPSSRTELYQIIVRCLLRRYCAKNNVKAAADNKAPEEQFKDSLLALGKLAWRCLKKDRFSFREKELVKFESKMKTLAARKLGLVFKEASAKKINPQHEYHFLHKTFQEYLAALYLAHKLLNEKVNVFRDLKLKFYELTSNYNQVFIFLSGILGEDAVTLFDHIGENLQMTDWYWPNCTGQEATFFIECFSENRNAEQIAVTLCSYVPFPHSIFINMSENSLIAFLSVVNACKSFTQLQLPVHLTAFDSYAQAPPGFDDYPDIEDWGFTVGDDCDKFLASYSRLETIVVSNFDEDINVTPAVCSALQVNLSLHSFTFERHFPFSSEEAVAIGDSLAANKALQTMTLKLLGQLGENWTTVLEKGLSGERPLTSVVLEINGSVRESEKKPLKKLLWKRSLKSLSLAIYGDMHDSLATSIGEGLATNPFLQSLTLIVYGSVSCSAFTSLKMGVLGNSALKSLELEVFGGLPDNWVNICEALYAAKRSSCMSLTIKPDVVGKITTQQVACLRPVRNERVGAFKLHSFTVNMWGELSWSGASDLCKLLIASRVSCVNLNIHGRVTDSVATCLAKNFDKVNSCPLSDLSINIRGELTRDGNRILQSLRCNQTFAFTLNVQDVNVVDKICDEVKLYAVDSSSLKEAFTKFESICSRVSKLSLNLDNPSNSSEVDWGCSAGDVVAKFVSLATLSLSFNQYDGWREGNLGGLWSGVAQNTSITTLSITINNYNREFTCVWIRGLWDSLNRNTSITTLIITLNIYSEGDLFRKNELYRGLKKNTSVTALSITENIYCDVYSDYYFTVLWGDSEVNTSLTTLSIMVNNYKKMYRLWAVGPPRGLEQNLSITTLNISVNHCGEMSGYSVDGLFRFLSENTSLATLNLALYNHSNSYECYKDWIHRLNQALEMKESPIRICLEVNVFSERN